MTRYPPLPVDRYESLVRQIVKGLKTRVPTLRTFPSKSGPLVRNRGPGGPRWPTSQPFLGRGYTQATTNTSSHGAAFGAGVRPVHIPKSGHTQAATRDFTLDNNFAKGVTHVRIPARGDTQDATYWSDLETDFAKGVSPVPIPKSGHTWETTHDFNLASDFGKGV